LARAKVGKRSALSMAIIAITTSNSINVNPLKMPSDCIFILPLLVAMHAKRIN